MYSMPYQKKLADLRRDECCIFSAPNPYILNAQAGEHTACLASERGEVLTADCIRTYVIFDRIPPLPSQICTYLSSP